MEKYRCTVCWFIYSKAEGYPEGGIEPGTKWEEMPGGYACPVCGADKSKFEKV